MTLIDELERQLNDVYSWNYANDADETSADRVQLNKLIEQGVKIGSPYAIKLKAMQLYRAWVSTEYQGPCPDGCKEMLEQSARHGFGECMWVIAEDFKLGFSYIEMYAFRKASQFMLEDLDYYNLDGQDLKDAEALAAEIERGIIRFYEDPQIELLIGSGYDGY
jgi:hypothetical protein